MKKVKIDINIDYITLSVYDNGKKSIHFRWVNTRNLDIQEDQINKAKIAAFDLIWELTELGYKVELIPYLN